MSSRTFKIITFLLYDFASGTPRPDIVAHGTTVGIDYKRPYGYGKYGAQHSSRSNQVNNDAFPFSKVILSHESYLDF